MIEVIKHINESYEIMLMSGDNERTFHIIANRLGITNVLAQVLPDDKAGTDIAMSAGNVILIKSDLYQIISMLKLGKYSMKKIKQNLGISFAYNVITISIAAGLFYGFTDSLILTPSLAALGWIVSANVSEASPTIISFISCLRVAPSIL